MQGKVKFFNKERGFGFIAGEDKDYFIHFSEIKGDEKILFEGDEVEFDPEETKKGPQAINVKKTKEY